MRRCGPLVLKGSAALERKFASRLPQDLQTLYRQGRLPKSIVEIMRAADGAEETVRGYSYMQEFPESREFFAGLQRIAGELKQIEHDAIERIRKSGVPDAAINQRLKIISERLQDELRYAQVVAARVRGKMQKK